ncbi:hypothetical protein AVEN_244729-1 [Araneus ventricosus]|uniref:Uncharacterized protein n=1 Tax=Araneus ventricosus TaxID=182803 RepID=A0A4Y2BS04_ARAVE|nr:hypothetical protein AVEN_244729-1 [Araneus ventricosus]
MDLSGDASGQNSQKVLLASNPLSFPSTLLPPCAHASQSLQVSVLERFLHQGKLIALDISWEWTIATSRSALPIPDVVFQPFVFGPWPPRRASAVLRF